MASTEWHTSQSDSPRPPSLNGEYATEAVSVTLTEAGLLPDRATELVQLYAEHRSWQRVKEVWHHERVGNRGTRESAQRIFRALTSRLQDGVGPLPSIPRLADLLEACQAQRQRAQLLYLYLVESDPLVRYMLHEVLRDGWERSTWPLEASRLHGHLEAFRYANGELLEYASSTQTRWVEGFRSVLHDIGVREGEYDDQGELIVLERLPLLVAAGYSWHRLGPDWVERPMGWSYLFQPEDAWEMLFDRVSDEACWQVKNLRTRLQLEPVDDEPFSFEM